MQKAPSLFWSLTVCVLLSACGNLSEQPTAIPSTTSIPTAVALPSPTKPRPTRQPTRTPIPTPTPSRTPVPTPTHTPFPPYPTKEVLFDYNDIGCHTPYDMVLLDYHYSRLVIYTDGQMIIPGRTYQQKILSPDEIDQFLSQLEALGFFDLKSNQHHDPTDQLYYFGDQFERVFDGLWYCVVVNGNEPKQLCAHEPQAEFLVPEMKNILQFLEDYQPEGVTPYIPDRILLNAMLGRNPAAECLPEETIPWLDSLPSIETDSETIIYADGETAREIYALFGNQCSRLVFTQNGIEYTVYLKILLPHHEITNTYLD